MTMSAPSSEDAVTEAQPSARAVLFRKIAAVAAGCTVVEKDGKNLDQKYRYATPAAVFSVIKPLLAEQQLALVPHLVEFTEIDTGQRSGGGKPFIINRVTMHYHLLDGETGEELVVPWQGQAGTYGDDKGLAKAQTIALRTFFVQLFQIPAEDPDTDPDRADARPVNDARNAPPQRPAPPRPPAPQAATPPAPSRRPQLLKRIADLTAEVDQAGFEVELAKPLDQMNEAELIEHGQRLAAAVKQAQRAPALNPAA